MPMRWLILGLLALLLGGLAACRQYPGDPDYSDAPPRQPTNAAPERGEGR
ncbi:MAG: hypothetical protein KatS3mg020_0543 [Fimbriimonadales bacterium]|nr:MAG: hypothetical protein KatS3mg019_0882 [Fimbriimonadales bacterium]GIV11052.1 MAG: hypothetical protein KatS3mg020_0543 [Fimbriimonadales bacterium]